MEKGLKAWFSKEGKSVPRTHRMADLLTLVPATIAAEMREEILLLDRFYIPTPYPDALPGSLEEGMPNKQEAQEALDIAIEVLNSIGATL